MRQKTIARMAKLDDEEFSLSSMDEEMDEEKNKEENGEKNEEEDRMNNEKMEQINGFRPVDDETEDEQEKNKNFELTKSVGELMLLNVPSKEMNKKINKKKMKRSIGGGKALIQSVRIFNFFNLIFRLIRLRLLVS
jgi:hypothetical protein